MRLVIKILYSCSEIAALKVRKHSKTKNHLKTKSTTKRWYNHFPNHHLNIYPKNRMQFLYVEKSLCWDEIFQKKNCWSWQIKFLDSFLKLMLILIHVLLLASYQMYELWPIFKMIKILSRGKSLYWHNNIYALVHVYECGMQIISIFFEYHLNILFPCSMF